MGEKSQARGLPSSPQPQTDEKGTLQPSRDISGVSVGWAGGWAGGLPHPRSPHASWCVTPPSSQLRILAGISEDLVCVSRELLSAMDLATGLREGIWRVKRLPGLGLGYRGALWGWGLCLEQGSVDALLSPSASPAPCSLSPSWYPSAPPCSMATTWPW